MSTKEFTEEQITGAPTVPDRTHVDPAPPFDPECIARAISASHGATWQEVKSPLRFAHLVNARREIYAALREHGWSFPAIGRFVGDRDHTTVMYALSPMVRKTRWATRADKAVA